METLLCSASQTVVIGPERPFVIIGERINPTGRQKLTQQLLSLEMDLVRREAVRQVAAGAQVLDINCGVPDEREPEILAAAIQAAQAEVPVPLSIDSSVVEALRAALSVYRGKALVNSVTGEDERLEAILPLVKQYGAAVVGVASDEQGIPTEPQTRLAIARKIVQRAADHGIPPDDVLIDPLVLTVSADHHAAQTTLQTIRLIRAELGVNLTCGASNVSFGLPWRVAVNATFLAMAITAGLNSAITNPLEPEIRRCRLAADLLLGRDPFSASFLRAYRAEQAQATSS
jgi:5-methyltetrahydrofolate--homocysteine methyltransferase